MSQTYCLGGLGEEREEGKRRGEEGKGEGTRGERGKNKDQRKKKRRKEEEEGIHWYLPSKISTASLILTW